jgi:hypothetical protein
VRDLESDEASGERGQTGHSGCVEPGDRAQPSDAGGRVLRASTSPACGMMRRCSPREDDGGSDCESPPSAATPGSRCTGAVALTGERRSMSREAVIF